ncbi:hypothetical protein AB9M62_42535 [Bacillales bacterium AN1005]
MTLMEPSGFRTDWGGRSSVKTETSIPELKESIVGQMLQGVQLGAGQEAGDPAKAAEAVIKVVETTEPPLRLLLGQQAYDAATYKFNNMLSSIEEWKEITVNADYKQ